MKHIAKVLTFFLLLAVQVSARNTVYTLEECLERAQSTNQVKVAEKKLEIAEKQKGTYLDIPMTEIELVQSPVESGGPDNGLTISQEFEFPTLYIAKRKKMTAEEALAKEEYGEVLMQTRAAIISEYYRQVYLKEKVRLLYRDMEMYEEFVRISEVRYSEGETSRLESLNAARKRVTTETAINEARLNLKKSQLALALLIGMDSPIEVADTLLSIFEIKGGTMGFEPTNSYSSRILNARLEINKKDLALARQGYLPSLSVGATGQVFFNSFNPYHIEREKFRKGDFMGFSVGMSIPLVFVAQRSREAAARREIELTRLMMEDEEQRLMVEYLTMKAELDALQSRLEYYEREGLPNAEEIRHLANVSYTLGEIDYMEYIQNIEVSTETMIEYIDCIAQYNQTLIEIQTIKAEI